MLFTIQPNIFKCSSLVTLKNVKALHYQLHKISNLFFCSITTLIRKHEEHSFQGRNNPGLNDSAIRSVPSIWY